VGGGGWFVVLVVEHNKYVAIDMIDHYETPRVEKATLSFQPDQFGETPFTITRKKSDET
jgi:hypothetical protein